MTPNEKLYRIKVLGSDLEYLCSGRQTLLDGLKFRGEKAVTAGCRGGGCGICRVQIVSGEYIKTGTMSRDHVTEQGELLGDALACCINPASDIVLFPNKPARYCRSIVQ